MTIKRTNKHFGTTLSILLACLAALSPLAIDTFLSSMPNMATFFGTNIHTVQLTVTVYFLGFALGNFFGGPLSDAFGRKTIALTGIIFYGLSALLISQCTKIEHVLMLRILQAFGGGFATVTANVFIRDWYTGKDVARFVTIISMIMMLAPLFAPVIGTAIAAHSQWQGVFLFLSIFALVLLIIFTLLIPESREKALLTRRITAPALLGKYKIFFSDKKSVILLLSMSFSMAGLYTFLTGASFIYISYFNIPANQFPIYFGANILLNITFSLLNTYLLKKYSPYRLIKFGLILQLIAGLALAITVLLPAPPLAAVAGCLTLFIGSLGFIFGNGSAAILNINPKVSGSANATIGISRFLLSFFIGSVLTLFHTTNLIPIGITMCACTLIGNVLFRFVKQP